MSKGIRKPLNPYRRYSTIFVDFKSIFHVFSSILLFFRRHNVRWRPCMSGLRSMDVMTQVWYKGIYFSAQYILCPANNSTWGLALRGHLVGNFGQSQISMGSHVNLTIPKCRRVWSTAQRYVGHKGLESTFRAYSGPSQTPATFAPTMSVRIFGCFWPFSIFLTQRAVCSAPP